MYAESFDKVISATSVLKNKVPKDQVAAIKNKFLPALEKKSKETKGEIRKAFEFAYNTFSSLHDGIKNGDVTRKDFQEAIASLQKLRKEVAKAEAPKPEEKKKEEAMPGLEGFGGINDSISDSGPGRNAKLFDSGLAVMKKYEKFRQLVPSDLQKKKMTAIKLPIVAVTDPLLIKERLAKFGLCDDTVFGYPFLKNQTLIGLNKDWVKEEFKSQTVPAVAFALDLLFEQTKRRYIQLGAPKMRGKISWVWVASDKDMLILNRVAGGGHFKVTGWDFPFEFQKR